MKVGVVGAGVMGTGVAQCFAAAGHEVLVTDPDAGALSSAPSKLQEGLRLRALLGSAHPEATDRILQRIRWSARLEDLADTGFVVECALERRPVKEQVFRDLDRVCPATAVLASCTSAIPIGSLGAVTARPDRVIGTHFMNPAPLKDTVEVIRPATTSDETLRRTVELLTAIGKNPIVVGDGPGFVLNRVLMLTVNQAVAVVHEGIADATKVDEIFEKCAGHSMGPLRTADLIGLDTVLDSLVVLRDCTSNSVFEPCPLLVDLVHQGHLGRKTGHGFHHYSPKAVNPPADSCY